MDTLHIISLVGALILSLFKYFEAAICYQCEKKGQKFISFLVGATIITIFVEVLDRIYLQAHSTAPFLIVFLPISFIALMLIERHIYLQKDSWHRRSDLRRLIKVISFSSGFVIGLISILDMYPDLFSHTIFILSLLAFDFIRELSISLIEKPKKRSAKEKIAYIFYCLSPVYGLLAAYALPISAYQKTIIVSLFGGAIAYVIFREVVIRREKKVEPTGIIFGSASMIMIFLFSALA